MNVALLDQLFVSGANFAVGILLARAFGLYEFGCFTLAWLGVEFMASLQFAGILQPMLNIGPKQAEADRDGYFQAVAIQQVVVCVVLAALAWLGLRVAQLLDGEGRWEELSVPVCAAICSYQLHNFYRRFFFLTDRPLRAFSNDGLRFAVQLVASVAIPVIGLPATAGTGIWILTAGCAASACLGMTCFVPTRWDGLLFRQVAVRHWKFGKWLLPSAVLFWVTSQAFAILSAIVLGPAVTGGLKAAMSITGLLNVLVQALDNFAPAQAAHAHHSGGGPALRRYIVRLALMVMALMAVGIAALNAAPELLVHLLYGEKFEGIAYLIPWFCAAAFAYSVNCILTVWVAAMEWTRLIFLSYVAATIFTLAAGYPLTLYGGVSGVVFGCILVECVRVAVLVVGLRTKGLMTWRRPQSSIRGRKQAPRWT
jgi:O-antigen/teichoic acid export membrane protein